MPFYKCLETTQVNTKKNIMVAQSIQGGSASYCDGRYTEENTGYKTITMTESNATYTWVTKMDSMDVAQSGTGANSLNVGDTIDISDYKYIGIYVMAKGTSSPGYAKFTLS